MLRTRGLALPPTICCDQIGLGSTRSHSNRSRRSSRSNGQRSSKSNGQLGRVDRSRHRNRHDGQRNHGGSVSRRPPRMVYYVTPEPPPPPPFHLSTLGMACTKPSQPVSKNPAVKEYLTKGTISTISKSESEIDVHEEGRTNGSNPDYTISSIANERHSGRPGDKVVENNFDTSSFPSILPPEGSSEDTAANGQQDTGTGETATTSAEYTESLLSVDDRLSKADAAETSEESNVPWWIAIKPNQQPTRT